MLKLLVAFLLIVVMGHEFAFYGEIMLKTDFCHN